MYATWTVSTMPSKPGPDTPAARCYIVSMQVVCCAPASRPALQPRTKPAAAFGSAQQTPAGSCQVGMQARLA